MKKRILIVFGTRPEAIKMCPIAKELKKRKGMDVRLCVTGQHEEMLKQVLDVFDEIPDYNLKIMQQRQGLSDITILLLREMSNLLSEIKPDTVLVHGDTLSAFVTALACYYEKIPVAHVEAGLRTYDIMSPYPEEFNRQAVDAISWLMFAPTSLAAENLVREGKNRKNIFITGNTVIDALATTISEQYKSELLDWVGNSRLVLLTAHRRENIGSAMENIFKAVQSVVREVENIKVVYPVHLNPAVRDIADRVLERDERIRLIEPLDVIDFHNLMKRAYVIVTDSGGIQEEAPALGKPVLVVRDTTERPEGVEAGTLKLVGTERQHIERELKKILIDEQEYLKMAKAVNPYGDGHASEKIADVLEMVLEVGDAG
ncbi:non-hydrolyzing UDP-N-acetylglucosamine 2-epimerase [Acetatifactor aquisgranensis]|uniref:non-hydrolyzing UDP-N-acetylglucosamine 2-epimerase n=1 Tax=Acetatifactor aquisgranensis TaxID=2941233 RepID=UPI00203C2F2A|nr:UDP-N-acetylglucosamine 2-epimerase (non-hydrolyzing) [Acetatifactor aquisgranensis]